MTDMKKSNREQYREANSNYDKAENKSPSRKNQDVYDKAVKGISQKERDKYMDEIVKENGPSLKEEAEASRGYGGRG
jgi:hypothetical protein